MTHSGWLRAVRWFGLLLSLAGVTFVGIRLWQHREELYRFEFGINDWLILAGLSLISAAAVIPLALGWRQLLLHAETVRGPGWALRVYGVSQIAKYLPGNVFQFVGRQMTGAADGVGHGPLANSSMLELLLVALAALCFTSLLAPIGVPTIGFVVSSGLFLTVSLLSAALVRSRLSANAGLAVLNYLAFFFVQGVIFVALFVWLDSTAGLQLTEASLLMGAFAGAWLAGFVTPGAPAGLGVRELVLLALLANVTRADVVLEIVILSRLISAAGDLVFYAWAMLSDRPTAKEPVEATGREA